MALGKPHTPSRTKWPLKSWWSIYHSVNLTGYDMWPFLKRHLVLKHSRVYAELGRVGRLALQGVAAHLRYQAQQGTVSWSIGWSLEWLAVLQGSCKRVISRTVLETWHLCISIYTCVYVCVCTVYICVCVHVDVYIYIYVKTRTYTYIHAYMYL